jgi:hypothetical protein
MYETITRRKGSQRPGGVRKERLECECIDSVFLASALVGGNYYEILSDEL